MGKKINWDQIKEWDAKYHIKVFFSDDEWQFIPIESTEGDYLIMPDGTRLLDCVNQLVCVTAGQKHPKIQQAIREASERYGFVWEEFITDYAAKACKLVVEDLINGASSTGGWAGKVSWASTGSEANEKAFIIARNYTGKPLIVTRSNAYHGWTAGAGQCTRIRAYRGGASNPKDADIQTGYKDVSGALTDPGFIVAPAPAVDEKKGPDGYYPSVKYTMQLIDTYGPQNIASMITEPVFGAAAIFPPEGYLPQLVEELKKRNILWHCDEVLCGCGKMGKWFGHELFGDSNLKPDIMTMAKGIVSSALPASCCVVSKEIGDFMGSIRWQHCGTFNAHPLSMAAVCANIEVLLENDAAGCSAKAGKYLKERFAELEKKHPTFGRSTGAGVLWAVDIVKDNATMEPFIEEDRFASYGGDQSVWPTKMVTAKAIEKGCLIGGFTPNTLRFALSSFVNEVDLEKAMDAMDHAFNYLDSQAKDCL